MTTARILLVDDVRVFLEFERSFFDRAGCEILTASSGPEALDRVRSAKPHAVLLDYEMPGMSGDEVCRAIKDDPATRHIPVLIVTSHTRPEVAERCRRAGCTDLIYKPVRGADLLEKVLDLLKIPYRVQVRCRVNVEVALGAAGEAVTLIGYSRNLSDSGMLLDLPEPVEAGSRVRLQFRLPGDLPSVSATAEVIRMESRREGEEPRGHHDRAPFSAALRFTETGAEDRSTLRRFVQRELGG